MVSETWMERALSCEQSWWLVGDSLAKSAEVVRDSVAELPPFTNRMVGAFVHGRGATSEGDVWRRRLSAEMLYAFAVENWLKGVLVASFFRSSGALHEEIESCLREELGIGEEFDATQFVLLLILAFTGYCPEPVASAQATYETQFRAENQQRIQAIKGHTNHDLVRLADAVQLGLDEELRQYLAKLSDVVQIGRYPAHIRKDVGDLTSFVCNEALRARLDQAISQRMECILSKVTDRDIQRMLDEVGE
jgi:hypothetical protein